MNTNQHIRIGSVVTHVDEEVTIGTCAYDDAKFTVTSRGEGTFRASTWLYPWMRKGNTENHKQRT